MDMRDRRKLSAVLTRLMWQAVAGVGRIAYGAAGKSFYNPVPSARTAGRETGLKGIDIDDALMLEFLDMIARHAPDLDGFDLSNGSFGGADAYALWGLLREKKPTRMIEVGSGNSTVLAGLAAKRNAEDGHPLDLLAIDPFGTVDANLLRQPVEDVDIELFDKLDRDDVLFIDSTHVLREGGDVWFLYCEVLPRLRTGVLVHVHDVALPHPYPAAYRQQGLFWTEQYLLQAFLAFNTRFRVIWAGAYTHVHHEAQVKAAIPDFGLGPGSLWMQVV
jgi:hypothetical protein